MSDTNATIEELQAEIARLQAALEAIALVSQEERARANAEIMRLRTALEKIAGEDYGLQSPGQKRMGIIARQALTPERMEDTEKVMRSAMKDLHT